MEQYGKPIDIAKLTQLLNSTSEQVYSKNKVNNILKNSNKFFLVDAYNGDSARIWALNCWDSIKKSICSYDDWDTYTPRIGFAVLQANKVLKKEQKLKLEDLRNYLTSTRHQVHILEKVFKHDPLFSLDGKWVSLNNRYQKMFSNITNSDDPLEHIWYAQNVINNTSNDMFLKMFFKLYSKSFSIEILHFWADLFGIDKSEVLQRIKNSRNILELFRGIYLANRVNSVRELKEILSIYQHKFKDFIESLKEVLKQANGSITLVLNHLPLTKSTLCNILHNHDEFVFISKDYCLPKNTVPSSLLILDDFRKRITSDIRMLIINTINNLNKPLTLKEIIFYSIGIDTPSEKLQALFAFALELINDFVYKIKGTEYWALTSWSIILQKHAIDLIKDYLEENDISTISEINKILKAHKINMDIDTIIKLMEMWPDFIKVDNECYTIRAIEFNDSTKKLIEQNIKSILVSRKEKGIQINELFEIVRDKLLLYGLDITKKALKDFLKAWGEVAIVNSSVFLMEMAPLNKMRLGDIAYCIVKEYGEPMPYVELEQEIRKRTSYQYGLSSVLLSEFKLSRPSRGYYALREWGLPEYNPEIHKQISKILIGIIKEKGRPMHKREIREALYKRHIIMNDVTLHMDLIEDDRIVQIARGVYSLTEWNLAFSDLIKMKLPFKLSLPHQDSRIIKCDEGRIFEYLVTKQCLELGRILIRRYMSPYFLNLEKHLRVNIFDIDDDRYMGWTDTISDKDLRWQIFGVDRWYLNYKVTYGQVIYIFQNDINPLQLKLYTTKQAEKYLEI
jgi:hypothetical protein